MKISGLTVTSAEATLQQVMTRLDALDRRLDRIEVAASHDGSDTRARPSRTVSGDAAP